MIDQFISDSRDRHRQRSERETRYIEDGQQPDTSGYVPNSRRNLEQPMGQKCGNLDRTPELKANNLIRGVELKRAKVHQVRGNELLFDNRIPSNEETEEIHRYEIDLSRDFVHSAMVDESYHLVGSHIDEHMQERIIRGEYIDFGRLVPKDRILVANDQRYEMVVREGKTYWLPVNLHESTAISNYDRWEQAFRVFSEIYMKAHPYRSSELVQYNHLIHMASQCYIWDNVYLYDKDFRIHMSKHPNRSWSIILQQAWMVRLRDKIKSQNGNSRQDDKKAELCKLLNKTGRCSFGSSCKYEHRCSYCFKFGHGAYNCWKLRDDRDRWRHSDRSRRYRSRSRSRDRYDKYSGRSHQANFNNSNNNSKTKTKAKK